MTGFYMINKIKRLEAELASLGMRWDTEKYKFDEDDSRLSVYPLDDHLPAYARDAALFTGSVEALELWLQGVNWARSYDMLLRLSDEKKRERKEQDIRNRQLMKQIKLEKIEVIEQ